MYISVSTYTSALMKAYMSFSSNGQGTAVAGPPSLYIRHHQGMKPASTEITNCSYSFNSQSLRQESLILILDNTLYLKSVNHAYRLARLMM